MDRYELRAMGRYTDEQPFSCKVICGNCGKIYSRRTWTRSNGKFKVWQCYERYKVKGVIGCKSDNLYERDLEKAFVMAWNGIIEQKDDFMERWLKQEKDGNPLERLKARQFRTIVEKGVLLEEVDNNLVNLFLEHIEVYKLGILKFYFIDGTEIEIAIN